MGSVSEMTATARERSREKLAGGRCLPLAPAASGEARGLAGASRLPVRGALFHPGVHPRGRDHRRSVQTPGSLPRGRGEREGRRKAAAQASTGMRACAWVRAWAQPCLICDHHRVSKLLTPSSVWPLLNSPLQPRRAPHPAHRERAEGWVSGRARAPPCSAGRCSSPGAPPPACPAAGGGGTQWAALSLEKSAQALSAIAATARPATQSEAYTATCRSRSAERRTAHVVGVGVVGAFYPHQQLRLGREQFEDLALPAQVVRRDQVVVPAVLVHLRRAQREVRGERAAVSRVLCGGARPRLGGSAGGGAERMRRRGRGGVRLYCAATAHRKGAVDLLRAAREWSGVWSVGLGCGGEKEGSSKQGREA